MSRTQAHKPWKYRSEDEKPQGGSGYWGTRYTRILHSYGMPRVSKDVRRKLEKANRARTKLRLNGDVDNYVDSAPEIMINHIC